MHLWHLQIRIPLIGLNLGDVLNEEEGRRQNLMWQNVRVREKRGKHRYQRAECWALSRQGSIPSACYQACGTCAEDWRKRASLHGRWRDSGGVLSLLQSGYSFPGALFHPIPSSEVELYRKLQVEKCAHWRELVRGFENRFLLHSRTQSWGRSLARFAWTVISQSSPFIDW